MLPNGGSASQDTSECHSSPATCFEFSSAWIVRISGWPSGACGEAGWIASSPNSRPNALCWSCVSVWSRKNTTRFSISASCTSWNCWLPSGRDRSTPPISAPICGVSFLTSIVWYSIAVSSRLTRCHCERSEAISHRFWLAGRRLLRRCAPRNDGKREDRMARKELKVDSVAEAYLALLAERGIEYLFA